VTRLLHEATLSFVSLPNIWRVLRRASEAYVVSPALSYAFTAMLLAKVLGVRTVLVVKDVMPDAAVELGMLRNRAAIALSRWIARKLYQWADEIHTLGEGMRQRIARRVEREEKIRIVPDTIDGAELAPVAPANNEFRKRFAAASTFAVLHTGNMGQKQDLDLILRAARRLRSDSGIHFYVFGDGAVKQDFLRQREEWRLDNVSHFPLQERWMLRHMLSGADVVLVSQLPEVVDIVVPSKLITALGAGAMVVAACAPLSETARLIRESKGGVWVPASDDLEFARALERIRRGDVDVQACRRNGREFAVRMFDRNVVYGQLLRRYVAPSERPAQVRQLGGSYASRSVI